QFSPRVLACAPGTRLQYTNVDSPCLGFQCSGGRQAWNEQVPPGGKAEHVLEFPGTFQVTCPLRPYMVAWVRVVASPYLALTDAEGRFSLGGVPPGKYRVVVWHEAVGNLAAEAGPSAVTVAPALNSVLEYRVRPR